MLSKLAGAGAVLAAGVLLSWAPAAPAEQIWSEVPAALAQAPKAQTLPDFVDGLPNTSKSSVGPSRSHWTGERLRKGRVPGAATDSPTGRWIAGACRAWAVRTTFRNCTVRCSRQNEAGGAAGASSGPRESESPGSSSNWNRWRSVVASTCAGGTGFQTPLSLCFPSSAPFRPSSPGCRPPVPIVR